MGFEVDQQSQNKEIGENIKSGKYFQNALDYYFFSFLSIFSQRNTILFFLVIIAIVTYNFFMIIKSSFPLKEKFDMVLFDRGDIGYKTVLKEIYYPQAKSIDEKISTYLILEYIKQRENFNFSELEYNGLRKKIRYIKNNSSANEYSKYMAQLNKKNKNSPLKNWGKDITRKVKIKDFRFIELEIDTSSMTLWKKIHHKFIKATEYINPQLASTIEVDYVVFIYTNKKLTKKTEYQNKIEFYFSGVKNNNYTEELKLIINDYKIFKYN
jgi:type IV secretory pathway component VirB8